MNNLVRIGQVTGIAALLFALVLSSAAEDRSGIKEELKRLWTEATHLEAAGEYRAASARYRQALASADALGHQSIYRVEALVMLGKILLLQGEYKEAERHLLRAWRLAENRPNAQAILLVALHNLAALKTECCQQFGQASALIQQAILLKENLGQTKDGLYAVLHANAAKVLVSQGEYSAAEHHVTLAIAILENLPGYELKLAETLFIASAVHSRTHSSPTDLELLNRGLHIYENRMGPEHPGLVMPLRNLGDLHLVHGHPDLALEPLSRAIRIAETRLGPDHLHLGLALEVYADALRRTGHKREAKKAKARAGAIGALYPARRPGTVVAVSELMRERK